MPQPELLPYKSSSENTSEARKERRDIFLSLPGVADKLQEMASSYGIGVEEILGVIEKETGGSYSPQQQNFGGGGARGLIQFLAPKGKDSKTIGGKEYKISDIENMDVLTQLGVADDFFKDTLSSAGQEVFKPGELGLAVALPSFVGKNEEWVEDFRNKNPKTWRDIIKNNPGWVGEDGMLSTDSIAAFYTKDIPELQDLNFEQYITDKPIEELPEDQVEVAAEPEEEKPTLLERVGINWPGKKKEPQAITVEEKRQQMANAKELLNIEENYTTSNFRSFWRKLTEGETSPITWSLSGPTSWLGVAGEEISTRGRIADMYQEALDNTLSEKETDRLNEKIIDLSSEFWSAEKEAAGDKWNPKAMKLDFKTRDRYVNFIKDKLSYLDDDGNLISLSEQDLGTVQGMNETRAMLAQVHNLTSNKKFGEQISGKARFYGFGFDTYLTDMFQDSDYTMYNIAMDSGVEAQISNSVAEKFLQNDVLKDLIRKKTDGTYEIFLPEGAWGTEWLVGEDLQKNEIIDNMFNDYLANNPGVDTRVDEGRSATEEAEHLLQDIGGTTQPVIDPDAGRLYDEEGREIAPVTDLTGLKDDELISEMTGLQGTLDQLQEKMGSADLSESDRAIAVQEIQETEKMLSDIERERDDRSERESSFQSILDSEDIGAMDNLANQLAEEYAGATDERKKEIDAQILSIDDKQNEVQGRQAEVDEEDEKRIKRQKRGAAFEAGLEALKGMGEGAVGLVQYALGKKSLNKAMDDITVEDGHKLDASWQGYMNQMKNLSQSGLSAEEMASAKQDLTSAFHSGVTNVMRAAGGDRAALLGNVGVLNANRVKGLLKLSAMDAATRRQNLQQYGQALKYQQEHGRMTGEIDRRMAYSEAKRKSDIHGTIGATLIGEALKSVTYGMEKRANSAYDNAMTNNLMADYFNRQQKSDAIEDA